MRPRRRICGIDQTDQVMHCNNLFAKWDKAIFKHLVSGKYWYENESTKPIITGPRGQIEGNLDISSMCAVSIA